MSDEQNTIKVGSWVYLPTEGDAGPEIVLAIEHGAARIGGYGWFDLADLTLDPHRVEP